MPGMIDCHTHVLLQGDITSEDYDVQVLKESIDPASPHANGLNAMNNKKMALIMICDG
jgi:imidazolonepropionase-like amidohydrolase